MGYSYIGYYCNIRFYYRRKTAYFAKTAHAHFHNGSLVGLSRLKIVRGTPISLLKLPWFFSTLKPFDSTAATISLVLVFPTLPVIPTKGS